MEIGPAPDGNETAPQTESGVKFVSFYLGENLYAIHAPAVAEVTQPLPVTQLPGTAGELRGISSLRGDIVAKVDIKQLVGETSRSTTPKGKTLVLKSVERDDTPIAFDVDKLGEIVTLPVNELRKVTGRNDKCLFGESTLDARSYFVIDHTKLLSALS